MSEETVTLRFPKRLHVRAKLAATEREQSIQDFVGDAVESVLAKGGLESSAAKGSADVARRMQSLEPRRRKIAERFLQLLEVSPEFYLRAIDAHITSLLSAFRQADQSTRRMIENI